MVLARKEIRMIWKLMCWLGLNVYVGTEGAKKYIRYDFPLYDFGKRDDWNWHYRGGRVRVFWINSNRRAPFKLKWLNECGYQLAGYPTGWARDHLGREMKRPRTWKWGVEFTGSYSVPDFHWRLYLGPVFIGGTNPFKNASYPRSLLS
jgi:hypothetical protein